jgi:hypothetical protein
MSPLRRSLIWACLVLPGLWFTCCCPPQTLKSDQGPQSVLLEYTRHLKSKQTDQAYELLSSRAKKHLDQKELRRFMVKNGERLAAMLEALFEASDVDVSLSATLRSEKGEEVHLVREEGTWRIESGALVPPTNATPEEAVRRFLLAIEAKNCEALLQCAPPPTRARLAREQLLAGCRDQIDTLQDTAAQISASGIKPVKVSEKRAELTYMGAAASSRKLIVVEYDGHWYIEDLL